MAYSVLIIDDEDDMREMLFRGLTREGFRVQTAEDGQDGLDQLKDSQFDLMITDLNMPILDGNTLLESIKEDYRKMIRVVITGMNECENIKRALNANTDHLIEKPIDITSINLLITKLLKERDCNMSPIIEGNLDDITHRLYELRMQELNLTEREQKLVTYILKGISNKGISGLVGYSEQVVKNAISNLYRKLGIGSRSQLFHVVFPI